MEDPSKATVLYFDCFSGASGDMLVGALLDLGVKLAHLEAGYARLGLEEPYHLHADKDQRQAIAGTKFTVHAGGAGTCHQPAPGHAHETHAGHGAPQHQHEHGHAHAHEHEHADGHGHHHHHDDHDHGRSFREIRELIESSLLDDWIKARAVAVFRRVAEAEGKVHGRPAEEVTFHEVGALDSILDIVGFCVALDKLGRPRVLASPLVDGKGWAECAHGRYPVPVMATLEILAARGVPLSQDAAEPHELLTPTGAALLAEFAESFEPMRDFRVAKVGYGLGTRRLRTRPNVVRAMLGASGAPQVAADSSFPAAAADRDDVVLLETNLDDVSGELLGHVHSQLLELGALDVWMESIQMKKNRPGVLLSVLVEPAREEAVVDLMLTETSAFGVRRSVLGRHKLRREVREVPTLFGPVEVKLGWRREKLVQWAPEYESCRRVAAQACVPLKDVYAAAAAAARSI